MNGFILLIAILIAVVPIIVYFALFHISYNDPDSWKLEKRIGMSGDMIWFVDRGVMSNILNCDNDIDAKVLFDKYVQDMKVYYSTNVEGK